MKKWIYSKNIQSFQYPQKSFLKNKKVLLLLGAGIILLMIFSVFTLFGSSNDSDHLLYNGYHFFLTGTEWVTRIDGQKVSFEQSPKELENVPVERFILPLGKIYLTYHPKDTHETVYEIQRLKAFLHATGRTVSLACVQEEGCPDIPLKTCDSPEKILYLKYGGEPRIYNQAQCIVLETGQDPSRVINRFIYHILGVMR